MDIGLLNEKPLHADLKNWYARAEDPLEVEVDGFVVDIVQDGILVEIQTGNFSGIRRKIRHLTKDHEVRLVYPIAFEKWIVKSNPDGTESRRKSPKRGRLVEVFKELVSFPELLNCSHFSLEVLLIREEEIRRYRGSKAWRRRGWVIEERRLLEVLKSHRFEQAADLWALMPAGLPDPFTTTDLARKAQIPRHLSQQAAYCLRKTGVIETIGKHGRSNLYTCRISIE